MAHHTIIAGILLIVLGLGFFIAPLFAGEGLAHWTALIPAMPGLVLTVLGALALAQPHWRKHLMHAAMTVGMLVVLAGLGRGVPGLAEPGPAVVASLLMGLIALVYVGLGVKSFIDARRAA